MRKLVSWMAMVSLVALFAPALAGAQEPAAATPECGEFDGYRNFFGKVDRVSRKELILDNRKGDKLKFVPAKDVQVVGLKTDWERIKKNDWAIAAWKMSDNPRVAYKVCVKPEQQEAGEFEE